MNNPQIHLFNKMSKYRKDMIIKGNKWMNDIPLVAGCFKKWIIFFNFNEMRMTSFNDILKVVNHEYLHHVLWRIESEKTCSKLDNIRDFFNGMEFYGC